MKKNYLELDVEIIRFAAKDVITESKGDTETDEEEFVIYPTPNP